MIHLNKVLEHVASPTKMLQLSRKLVRPGGVVCVAVPNDFNPFQTAFVSRSGAPVWWVSPRHHINYFNFTSLEQLFRAAGLKPVERDTDFPMELFLLMGDNYTSDPGLGKALHAKRRTFDLALAHNDIHTRRNFYRALASAGLGRVAIVYGIRHER